MYLKRATITGFKSFANKTVLDLEPGITGIVGPNGSGKSNLADAVRWALGEQGKGVLRLSDREEVVFAGTTKRAKGSFAEVTLLFDNESGTFPLDLTEVEISRRLYRSGEAEYRLAGRKVRLSDIQTLLAQAGFGAGSYAVIGQGMIDSLLLSSPAERKALFDEAAGIRAPELGREAAQRKLAATSANLTRLRDIVTELEPRLQSLQKSVAATADRDRLEKRSAELKSSILAASLHHWTNLQSAATTQLETTAAQAAALDQDQTRLATDLAAAQAADAASAAERHRLQQSLATLQSDRDALTDRLTAQRASVTAAEHHATTATSLERDIRAATRVLETAQTRQSELEAELSSNATAARRALDAVERTNREVTAAQAALIAIRQDTGDGTRDQYLDHALQILKMLASGLSAGKLPPDQIRLLVHKVGRLLKAATRDDAAELLTELDAAQKRLETAMAKRETAIEHQTNITITGRSLEIDLTHQRQAVTQATTRLSQLQTQLEPHQTAAAGLPQLKAEAKKLAADLAKLTTALDRQRSDLTKLTAADSTVQRQIDLAAALERAKSAAATAQATQVRLQTELQAAQAGLAATREQAATWGLPLSAVPQRLPHDALDHLRDQLARTDALLEARRATQADVTAEYDEVSTRHTDLTAQIADLETAQTDLTRVIAELDDLIRDRFRQNFQALAEQFSIYFARLFDGGSASLELSEDAEGSYGIVIKASPKGKRLTAIAALSGGERAMAGVALLAAILRVNPSPFVVLDEIDAALDEANSGRLSSILSELAQHSQLIIITHNRQTMRAADVLFGVTINEHHVSHLLSIRLEQATQLAAR